MKTNLGFALILIVGALVLILNAQSSSQDLTRYYIVKLYSGDKVIAPGNRGTSARSKENR